MPLSLSLADSIYQTVWLCVSSYVELRFTVTTNRCCVWCWTTAVGPMMSFVAKSWSPFESTDWVGEGYLWNCAVYAVELYEHSLVAIVHLYLTYTTNAHPTVFQDSIYHPKKHCHHWLEGTGTERKIQTHVNPPAILDKDSIHGCFERCFLQMAQHVASTKSSIIQRVGHCVRWYLFSLKHTMLS